MTTGARCRRDGNLRELDHLTGKTVPGKTTVPQETSSQDVKSGGFQGNMEIQIFSWNLMVLSVDFQVKQC